MKRREFIASAALAVPALTLTRLAAAAETASGGSIDEVVKAAQHCLGTGIACLRHCQEMLAKGETSMADCEATTENMLAACEAMVKIGGYRSAAEKDMKAMARACAAFCRACVETCAKHKQHAPCAACLESCAACAKACEAYAG